jgi:hypothetical protein
LDKLVKHKHSSLLSLPFIDYGCKKFKTSGLEEVGRKKIANLFPIQIYCWNSKNFLGKTRAKEFCRVLSNKPIMALIITIFIKMTLNAYAECHNTQGHLC